MGHEETTYAETRTPLLSVYQVAGYLGITPRTVYRLLQRGDLRPAGRVGARLRFRPEDIDRYLERGAP